MSQRLRTVWIVVFAAAASLAVQSLLIVEQQCRRVEKLLSDDLRVVFFLRGPIEEGPRKILEEKLRAQPETAELRYVSPGQAWAALHLQDPELVDSVAVVSDNPLPGSFEMKPTSEALPRLAAWVESARSFEDWSDVRWKPAELQAALRARFYDRWLRLILSTLVCVAASLTLWALALRPREGVPGERRMAFAGALGGAGGMVLAGLAAAPLRADALGAWPPAWTQAVVAAACVVLGWWLCLWRQEP